MSLLVMSTGPDSPPSKDKLSPSWIRRASVPFRRKSVQDADSRPSTSNSLLSPRPTSSRTNSEEAQRERSKSPDSRTSFRNVVNRLRSSSSASSLGGKVDDTDIHDWFQGFRRYNQLVTTQFSSAPSFNAQDLTKATKTLTKNCGGQLIHGLPEAAFDFSLLWCPAAQLARRDTTAPTWSWTAYTGQVTFPFDPTTCPDLTRTSKAEGSLFRSEITNFHIGPASTPYTIRREKNTSMRSTFPPYFHAPRGSDASLDADTLRFTAATIPADGFSSEQLDYNNKPIPVCHLLDDKSQHCGVIMAHHDDIAAPSSSGPFEFVALSRNLRREASPHTRRPANPTIHPPGTPIWDGEGFVWDEAVVDFDEGVFADGEWSMVNVMLVKWVGEHAERVAVGRIHEDTWAAGGPVRREIVLR
ncbi:hypothetical protein HBI15_160500 [Parastagonospora nodorum]|nr:hypothetical protein HBI15_160500 [Parastagonospora nodorum]